MHCPPPLLHTEMNITVNISVVKGELYDLEEVMTIEVLKSMAKEGQMFSFDCIYKKT